MTVLLDVNVVLDVLLPRASWQADAEAVWDAHRDGRINALFCAASLPTVFYVVRKQVHIGHARSAIDACLQGLTIAPVDRSTAEMAHPGPAPDFEDNLQIACAVQAKADAIVTRDPKGFAASPVPALNPGELLTRLAAGDPDTP